MMSPYLVDYNVKHLPQKYRNSTKATGMDII